MSNPTPDDGPATPDGAAPDGVAPIDDGAAPGGTTPTDDSADWNRDFDPRSDARERALNILFEADVRGCASREVVERIQVPLDALTTLLVDGVEQHRARIDELISSHSHAWSIDRMATTDRNVLRVATFELIGRADIPTAVVLNEAVGLAKRYGTDDSGRFVNGMLSAIARTTREGAKPVTD